MALSTFLKIGSTFALVVGGLDALLGAGAIEPVAGVPLPVDSVATITADSQIRFLGTMWAGYGAMLWWVSKDVKARRVPFGILGVVLFVGGIARSISAAKYGFPVGALTAATAVELVVPPAIWLLGGW